MTQKTENGRTLRRRRRRGSLTVELVVSLPILLIVLFAMVQFGLMLMASQAVGAAASVGARQATLPHATAGNVALAVRQALAGWKFAGQESVDVRVNGQPASASPLENSVTGDLVSVTVRVPTLAATPNPLRMFGYSLEGQLLQSTFVMRKE